MIRLRPDFRRASLPVLATAVTAFLPLAACAKKQERPPRPVPTVSVVPVRRATVPYVIEANGVVQPLQTVSVLSQVDGILNTVDFEEGQDVSAGQPLFRIDPRPYQNAYDNAVAILARDSASAANAAIERDRYKQMLTAKVITPEEAQAQFTTSATSDATVRADRANAETAKFNLENTVIRAPIGGKTGSLLVRKGNLVRSGLTTLVVINQVRPILVRFAIPSSQLGLILQYGAKGGLPVTAVPGGVAPASPSIDSLAASVMNPVGDAAGSSANVGGQTDGAGAGGSGAGAAPSAGGTAMAAGSVPSNRASGRDVAATGGPNADTPRVKGARHGGGFGGRRNDGGANGGVAQMPVSQAGVAESDRVMGKLSFIDNQVDTTTATVQLKALFDNANGHLWAGEFATTSLHLFDEDNVLVVPTQAVLTGQRGTYVYVVDQADTARQRAVIVERTSGNLSVISNGLHDGDRVVTDGQARLSPDSPIRLRGANDGSMPGGGGARRGRKGGKGAGGGGGGAGSGGGGSNPSGHGT